MDNYFKFDGEVVRLKDFGNNGGNVTVKGFGKSNFGNSEIELSVFMYDDVWREFQSKPRKYMQMSFEGHLEMRVHLTATQNVKRNIKMVADKFTCINKPNCRQFVTAACQ